MIYVVEANRGLCKIGYTKSKHTFKSRLQALQTHSSTKVRVLVLTHGNRVHEALIHDWLKQYRKAGEWFDYGNWMDPLMEHTLTVLKHYGVNFVLSHTPEQIRAYCPIPGVGPVPYIDPRGGGASNPQKFAGHTVRSWREYERRAA